MQTETFLSRLERALFFLLLLFLPTQLGKHFWPAFSYVHGVRIDFLSPTIYTTDILLLGLFLCTLFEKKLTACIPKSPILSLFLFIAVIGIVQAKEPLSGIYQLWKFLECLFLASYIASFVSKRGLFSLGLILPLLLGAMFESGLAILQFFQKGSLNGVLYFLGERMFTGQTPGIANASINGQLVLRPYGTLPHPNVLAGYVLICLQIAWTAIFHTDLRREKKKTIFVSSFLVLGSVALLLTFSRIAVICYIIFITSMCWSLIKKRLKVAGVVVGLVLFFGMLTPFGQRLFQSSLFEEAVVVRENLFMQNITLLSHNLLFGVGMGNSLYGSQAVSSRLLQLAQPVHMVPLFIAVETGFLGFMCFVFFIKQTFLNISCLENQKEKRFLFTLLGTVILLGLFDHYLATLQQGQLLFALVVGLCWVKLHGTMKKSSHAKKKNF